MRDKIKRLPVNGSCLVEEFQIGTRICQRGQRIVEAVEAVDGGGCNELTYPVQSEVPPIDSISDAEMQAEK